MFSSFESLVKEFPQLADHHLLRAVRAEAERVHSQYEAIKAEYLRTHVENETLRQKLEASKHAKAARTKAANPSGKAVNENAPAAVEKHGLFWLHSAPGQMAALPHCPSCRSPLEEFPPGNGSLLRCRCGFIACGLHPRDVPRIAVEVQRQFGGPDLGSAPERVLVQRQSEPDEFSGSDRRVAELASFMDQSPVMLWRSGKDSAVTYVSTACIRFTGRSFEQQIGVGWAENVHPEDRERSILAYEEVFSKRESLVLRYRLRRRDGGYSPIIVRGLPCYAIDGTFEGYVGGCIELGDML